MTYLVTFRNRSSIVTSSHKDSLSSYVGGVSKTPALGLTSRRGEQSSPVYISSPTRPQSLGQDENRPRLLYHSPHPCPEPWFLEKRLSQTQQPLPSVLKLLAHPHLQVPQVRITPEHTSTCRKAVGGNSSRTSLSWLALRRQRWETTAQASKAIATKSICSQPSRPWGWRDSTVM